MRGTGGARPERGALGRGAGGELAGRALLRRGDRARSRAHRRPLRDGGGRLPGGRGRPRLQADAPCGRSRPRSIRPSCRAPRRAPSPASTSPSCASKPRSARTFGPSIRARRRRSAPARRWRSPASGCRRRARHAARRGPCGRPTSLALGTLQVANQVLVVVDGERLAERPGAGACRGDSGGPVFRGGGAGGYQLVGIICWSSGAIERRPLRLRRPHRRDAASPSTRAGSPQRSAELRRLAPARGRGRTPRPPPAPSRTGPRR